MNRSTVPFIAIIGLLLSISLGSCKKSGCTDPNANNYDPLAVKNDGDCLYLKPLVQNLNFNFDGCKPPYWVGFTYELFDTINRESFSWDFGDGHSSSDANPIHMYDSAGIYTVVLTVSNPNGSDTKRLTFKLEESYPLTSFFEDRATNKNYRAPSQILFENLSRYSSNFFWEFGDGTTSTDKNPTYVYSSPGRYKVKLHAVCQGDTNIFEKDLDILGAPRTMEIAQVKLWLDPSFSIDTLNDPSLGLDPYVELLYNNQPTGSAETFFDVRGFPISWFLPADLFSGRFEVNNLNYSPSEEIKFEIWDDEAVGPHELITFFYINTIDWQDDFYPEILEWEDPQTNFKAFVFVKYY
jgi:hypothetical protein